MSEHTGSCPQPVELSTALVSGLDDALREHVRGCSRCAAELASHRRFVDAARELPIVEPTLDHVHDVRGALVAAVRVSSPIASSRAMWAIAGAVVLAAAAFLLVFGLRGSSDQPTTRAALPQYRGTIHPHDGAQFIRVGSVPDEIVRLTHGTLTVEVDKLHPGERFRVITDDGEVEVRGTAFDVSADDDHLRSVHVLHGRVEVRPEHSEQVVLDIGQRWDRAKVAHVDEPPLPAHDVSVAPDPTVVPTKGHASQRSTNQIMNVPGPRSATKRPIELLFDEGWSVLAAGDPKRAAAVFERAAHAAPNDPLAEDAWFWRASALARVGDTTAVDALGSFIRRYPRSPRAGEASAILGWLLLDRGDLDAAETRFRAAANDRVDAVRTSANKGLDATTLRRRQ
jgi:hypothetical protein